MILPKIKFKEMTLEENIAVIKWAYFDRNKSGFLSIHDYTVKYFPKLANINANLSRDVIDKKIEEVVTYYYYKQLDIIKKEIDRYNSLWDKYNNEYLELLSTYFKVDWPKNLHEIETDVGLIPIFPRYLDNFSFAIGVGLDDSKLLKVCAHETLHFMWFLKWKKMFPETPRNDYESPHLVWKYSEMVTDPILNNEPFSKIFNFNERGYDSFYELEDNGIKVMDNLRDIFKEEISIEDKINIGYKYVNKVLSNKKDIKY